MKSKRFEMKIPVSLYQELKDYADSKSISVSEAAKDAIKDMLNKKASK